MVVGGVALALVASMCLRQQRIFADLAQSTALAGQLREGVSILPIDLRGVSSVARDIRDARDTSIELRATIASAVVCDTLAGAIVLAAAEGDAALYTGRASPIAADDTAWVFTPADSSEAWSAYRISGVRGAPPGRCHAVGPSVQSGTARVALSLDGAPLFSLVGSPMRVTRAVRYSLYRSSDGSWNLGERDWNAVTLRFNTIQPVSGPYLSAASGGLVLRYYDSLGARLPAPVSDTRAIALIRFELRGQTKLAPRVVGAGAPMNRVDSVSAWIALRNRR